ncbi:MAG: hypothetical protein K8H88_10390 [Sandaracinaceae bacterium]|nr:hypothetical protein [Sandaracinaceae bacterium]
MSKFELKVRNMKTGEALVATVDSFEDAATFLEERPPFFEVLGVLSDVSVTQMEKLKQSMRPYDADELALKREYEAKAAAAAHKAYEAEVARLGEMEEQARAEARTADPDRPLPIQWDCDSGMKLSDPRDERTITDAARKAVEEWVAERNTWIEGRGQFVAECQVSVYPNEVPPGEDRVIRGGTFIPRLKS